MRNVFVFAALLVAAGVAWFALRPGTQPVPSAEPTRAIAVEPRVEVEDATRAGLDPFALPGREPPVAPVPIAAPAAPLPPPSVRFAEQLPVLVEQAMRGEPVAACRLALDATRCAAQRSAADFAERMERSIAKAPSGNDDLVVGAIARTQERAEAGAGFCDGVDLAALPDPDTYLRAAAGRFTARQKVLLAMTRQDGTLVRLPRGPSTIVRSGRSTDYLVPQFLADNDIAFLQAGIAAADPLAPEGMLLLHAPSPLPGSIFGLREALPDPHRFAGYALLMQRVEGSAALGPIVEQVLASTLARLPPERVTALQAAVEREARRWQRAAAGRGGVLAIDDEAPSALCES